MKRRSKLSWKENQASSAVATLEALCRALDERHFRVYPNGEGMLTAACRAT